MTLLEKSMSYVPMLKQYEISNFYIFKPLSKQDILTLKKQLLPFSDSIKGLFVISPEGCNATFTGSLRAVEELESQLTNFFGPLSFKRSQAHKRAFKRFKIDLRKEIVTLGNPDIVPKTKRNNHLSPKEWNKTLTSDKDILLLDVRNTYETEIGKFKNAIDLKMDEFREFPEKAKNLPKDKKVLMYCTGGIRCEKALLHLQNKGYRNVYQLEGGILNYFKESQPNTNHPWEGECFVFDHRVALKCDLSPSKTFHLCPHCGQPGKEEIKCIQCNKISKICEKCQKQFVVCSKNCNYHYKRLLKKQNMMMEKTALVE